MKDEWDTDLLHVQFDAQKITLEQLIEKISQEGLDAEVRKDRDDVERSPK